MKEINLDSNIKVKLPSYMDFLNLLIDDKQFNFTRIQHSELDNLIETYSNVSELIEDINDENWIKLARKSSQSKLYQQWHNPNEDGLKKIANMFKVIYHNTKILPDLLLGISTGVGFGTVFGDYDLNHPIQKKRITILKELTKNSDSLYHAGVIRHFGVMGESYDFFKKINEIGVNVIVFGPEYLKYLKNEFNILKFNHIEIPYKYTINQLDEFINKIKGTAVKGGTNLVLSSAGHPISANLSLELKDTGISSLDIGRGFDWNLKKYIKDSNQIKGIWLNQPEENFKKYINKLRNG